MHNPDKWSAYLVGGNKGLEDTKELGRGHVLILLSIVLDHFTKRRVGKGDLVY